jgi:hypothetical protein
MKDLTAHRFVLRSTQNDAEVGRAVVCSTTSYACVRWIPTDRLERRRGTPNLWHSFEQELAAGLHPGPQPQLCAAAVLLAGPNLLAVVTDYVGPVSVRPASTPAAALDRCLLTFD